MKLSLKLKVTVLISLLAVYSTGVVTWVLSQWFLQDVGAGPEPSVYQVWWLQIHGMVGIWFFALIGFLFNSHIQPSWSRGKKLKSGLALTSCLLILCLTVPGLYYISRESLRFNVAQIHTYLGLSVLGFFLIHYFTRIPASRPKSKRNR